MSSGGSGSGIDFGRIAEAALSNIDSLLADWFPNGKRSGQEFRIGNIHGDPGDSLAINFRTGAWADFAGDLKGGDLISLFAAIQGVGQGEAAKRLASLLSVTSPILRAPQAPAPAPAHPIPAEESAQIIPPPEGSRPDVFHARYGKPTLVHEYRTAEGRPLFFVARYDPPGEKKEFRPFSWDGKKWVKKLPEGPRPLYNLPALLARPKAQVILVEGEKACDALHSYAGRGFVAVTWHGGAQAPQKTDFSPLYGRKVILWPDNDKPGLAAMGQVGSILLGKAAELKIIHPAGFPESADAADFEFGSLEDFIGWVKPKIKLFHVETEQSEPKRKRAKEGEVLGKDSTPDPTFAARGDLYMRLGIARTKQGVPYCNADNVLRVLEGMPDFDGICWYDEFHQSYLTRWNSEHIRSWTDNDDRRLMVYLQRELGFVRISTGVVNDAIQVYATRHTRNEPREWMESLTWDGKQRLDDFLEECFGVHDNTEYVRAASKNWWISIVARVYEPGCKVDNMLVLESNEGQLKSSVLRVIGGKWYAESNENVTSKDFYMVLQGKMLVEISELDSFSNADITTVKKVVSCQTDRFRPPYGRIAQDFPRQCVFVGTTNEWEYLRSSTGSRRFWPVTVGHIDFDKVRETRDQLFAEAVVRYKARESWWEMPKRHTESAQEARRQADAWEDPVNEWLGVRSQTTVFEVGEGALKIEAAHLDRAKQMRIASVLRRLGWKRTVMREKDRTVRRWIAPDGHFEGTELPI